MPYLATPTPPHRPIIGALLLVAIFLWGCFVPSLIGNAGLGLGLFLVLVGAVALFALAGSLIQYLDRRK
jgi:hypothetical protein